MPTMGLTQGILHLPGSSYETKLLVERLLAEDRETHHCFFGKVGFHNHLPHHILAAYDLAAPAKVLQGIYDEEAKILSPINLVDRKEHIVQDLHITISRDNWTELVGPEKHYPAFLVFFKNEVARVGVTKCLEEYIFSPKANGNGTNMLLRFAGGALHPLIQVGYGVEFNEPSLVASGLAQTAVHNPLNPGIYDDNPTTTLSQPIPLLSIIRKMYDSDILHPVMPYQPDALLSTRIKEALTNGRPEEIRRLSSMFFVNGADTADIQRRIEEILWSATLLTFATGKHGRAPRLDFFLMHLLTSALFLPSLTNSLESPDSKARLLRLYVSVMLLVILLRGRPRIDPSLMMTYTAFPQPPVKRVTVKPDESALGDPRDAECVNPWAAITASVIHAPDAHTVKSLRTLYYAAQHYGETPPGGMPGAFDENGKESLVGASKLDGTIFIRAAGVLMNKLGWVSHGQREGKWDRTALGWDAAWDGSDPDAETMTSERDFGKA